MSEAQLEALIERVLQRQAERQEQARRPLTAQEAAERYCSGSLARWRDMRHRWPILDERAAIGPPGKGRRWDAEKLAAVFVELKPAMRRRRSSIKQ